ncbi:DNA adenine methylase [Halobaculum gomorrense]|uniref:site-specific DNA-methyltransferase (adenine-specific) n=1 Tax=Halobaculum gomorrense TaxID=43928 RepID=A0A1M5MM24_9EURY|nr:DNA adenine methylase [Halobaculum gomorrense]SHG77823.1 DNA adenine methylase [Halobaculum gomorrense]
MPDAVFPYPGGKSRFASWILSHVPEHECFVTVFGGAAGVLVNKDPSTSTVEVYNDKDGDLVHFFETLREQRAELVEWLEAVPYSREIHGRWAELFFRGYRPLDDVERAGRFFYLRYSQFGAKCSDPGGFGTSKVSNQALSYSNKVDRLHEFAERFEDVVVESLDWSEVFDKYDQPETVFYCDPPYVGSEDAYPVSDIDHEELVQQIKTLDGRCICSYDELPENVDGLHLVGRDEKRFLGNGVSGSTKVARENLLMNFDPETA